MEEAPPLWAHGSCDCTETERFLIKSRAMKDFTFRGFLKKPNVFFFIVEHIETNAEAETRLKNMKALLRNCAVLVVLLVS